MVPGAPGRGLAATTKTCAALSRPKTPVDRVHDPGPGVHDRAKSAPPGTSGGWVSGSTGFGSTTPGRDGPPHAIGGQRTAVGLRTLGPDAGQIGATAKDEHLLRGTELDALLERDP